MRLDASVGAAWLLGAPPAASGTSIASGLDRHGHSSDVTKGDSELVFNRARQRPWRVFAPEYTAPFFSRSSAGTIPSVSAPRVVFDSRRQGMLLIGSRGEFLGVDGAHRVLLWREAANGTWVLADTTGPRLDAPPRAAFDPMRGVLVVPVLQGPDAGVWEWSDGWRRLTAAGPSPRERFVMTYDESRRAMVIFGGRTDEQHYLNDLWSWDGTRWQSISSDSASAPSPRSDGSLFYEPRSRRLILIGGLGPGDVLHRETWVSVNATWSRMQ